MKEDYNNAAGILKNNKNVLFAEVNCDDAYIKQEICRHEDIKQYPTLKVFLNAKFLQLIHFSRTEEFVGYVRKFVKTDSVLLEDGNSEQFDLEIVKITTPVVLAYFQKENSESFRKYSKIANKLSREYKFYHTFDEHHETKSQVLISRGDILEDFGEPTAIAFDEGVEGNDLQDFSSSTAEENLEKFIKNNYYGTLPLLIGSRKAFSSDRTFTVLFFWNFSDLKNKKHKESHQMRSLIFSILNQMPNKLTQKYLPNSALAIRNEQPNLFLEMDIVDEFNRKLPTVIIFNDKGQRFLLDEDISLKSLVAFFEKFEKGTLKEKIKSRSVKNLKDLEKTYLPGNVHELIGDNFRSQIMSKNVAASKFKFTFLAITVKWCGHCKNLKPKLEKLAEKLKNNSDVRIAVVDSSENTIPIEFKVEAFPKIFWFRGANVEQKTFYEGKREVEEMFKFVVGESGKSGVREEL